MPFQKGNKHGKGGKRRHAGRPSKEKRYVRKLAAVLAAEFIEKHTKSVLETYLDNAKGHFENRYTEDGKKYKEWVVDPASTRHWIDKVTPSPKQRVEVTGKIETSEVNRDRLRELSKIPEAVELTRKLTQLLVQKAKHATSDS